MLYSALMFLCALLDCLRPESRLGLHGRIQISWILFLIGLLVAIHVFTERTARVV